MAVAVSVCLYAIVMKSSSDNPASLISCRGVFLRLFAERHLKGNFTGRMDDMKTVNGVCTSAKIFTDTIEDYALAQIRLLCDNAAFEVP